MLDEKIELLLGVIALLPAKLAGKLENVLELFINIILRIHLIPEPWRGKIGNLFAHNVLAIFKKAGQDTAEIRSAIAYWTVMLFDLDIDWVPGFELAPPVE